MLEVFVSSDDFQLTTSQGGRQAPVPGLPSGSLFQLTTSQGGRHASAIFGFICSKLSTHDLTRRSTAAGRTGEAASLFQLTTSQGGRPFCYLTLISVLTFQLTTSQGGRQ